jgi:hypothetical protein
MWRLNQSAGRNRGELKKRKFMHVKARCAGIQLPTRHCFASSAFRNLGLCPGENSSRHLNENTCLRFRAMMEPYSESRLFREKILPL